MRNIVCIGGSTGALDAIHRIVRRLPADLPAAVFVVRHISAESSGQLANILQPNSALPVIDGVEGASIQPGRITVAPPNSHLVLDRTHVHLVNGPKENWARPAIDPLFRTAAQFHGPRVIGIIISGKLDDGAAGLWAIKRRGGFAVVQDPVDASAPEMPRYALGAAEVDVVADADEIGMLIPDWCRQTSDFAVSELTEKTIVFENARLEGHETTAEMLDQVGISSGIVCPECGGQLWHLKEGPLRYRCHVGHAQTGRTLLAQQKQVVENAGWQLVRAIEEDDQLCVQMMSQDKLSFEEREILTSRLRSNREKLERMRPLLFPNRNDAGTKPDPLHIDANGAAAVGHAVPVISRSEE
jgi:two-component system, chemotaxis family, protein-glutamate methylesterase/glutaminase